VDIAAKKSLKAMTVKLRQLLEAHYLSSTEKESCDYAWFWAFRLAVDHYMTVGNIQGALPGFIAQEKYNDLPPCQQVLNQAKQLLDTQSAVFTRPVVLGWIHQYWYDQERKSMIEQSSRDSNTKITNAHLIPATQVYTDNYLVRFLVENSLGALWLDLHPDSKLSTSWEYFVRTNRAKAQSRNVSSITLLDPACGCGNFLLVAFDMLFDMYREEDRRLEPVEICASILNNSLFGIDIDEKAVAITKTVLLLRAKEKAPTLSDEKLSQFFEHVVAIGANQAYGEELGALARGDLGAGGELLNGVISRRFDVVVTNPPYIDKRDCPESIRQYLRTHYPAGAGNVYAAFILRCLELADNYVGMITPQTFLFLRSYEGLRKAIFGKAELRILAHLGFGAFTNAVVDTAAFVLRKKQASERRQNSFICFKLVDESDKAEALTEAIANFNAGNVAPGVFDCRNDLADGAPVTYWLGSGMLEFIKKSPQLRDIADVVLGMKTSDNKRFVRFWWELWYQGEYPDGWVPYEKEASGYKYYRNSAHCVRWNDVSQQFYQTYYSAQLPNAKYWFRPGIVYGLISSKTFAAKKLPTGHMTDMAASCIFPRNGQDTNFLLGLINSKLYRWLLKSFNPTVNFQPGDLQRLPVPALTQRERNEIGRLAEVAVKTSRRLRSMDITDRDYIFSPADYLPLAEKLPAIAAKIWVNAVEYVVARDSIDIQVAEFFRLPENEWQSVADEMGGIPCTLPMLADYEDGAVVSGKTEVRSREAVYRIKAQLRDLYEAGNKPQKMLVEEIVEHWSNILELHPAAVGQLLAEGGAGGWHCPWLEKQLAEDFVSAVILSLLGHNWPRGLKSVAPQIGIIPLTPTFGSESLLQIIRSFLEGYGNVQQFEAEFATAVGMDIDSWLATKFFYRHKSQFRKRPIAWQISSRGSGVAAFSCLIHCQQGNRIAEIPARYIEPFFDCCGASSKDSLYRLNELRNFVERIKNLKSYMPDPQKGIRLNLAPLQKAGLLAGDVLMPQDVAKAINDIEVWGHEFS
jgi:hypothetical protein